MPPRARVQKLRLCHRDAAGEAASVMERSRRPLCPAPGVADRGPGQLDEAQRQRVAASRSNEEALCETALTSKRRIIEHMHSASAGPAPGGSVREMTRGWGVS